MVSRLLAVPAMAGIFVSLLTAEPALADTGDDLRATADAEFNEGKRLLDAGDVALACAKFSHSQELDPKPGRLLNLAFCHEQEGKTASAWSEYNSAAALAQQKGQPDRVDFAHEHAAAVAKRLSFLHLDVPANATVVQIDGSSVPKDKWTMPVPLDPGEHPVVVSAPGKKRVNLTVTIATTPGVQEIRVASLEDAPAGGDSDEQAPAAARPQGPQGSREEPAPAAEENTPSQWPASLAAGVAIAGLGVGGVWGAVAISKKNQADPFCPNKQCVPQGRALINDAQSAALISTVGFGVGVAGAAAAVWLWLHPPGGDTAVAHITPVLSALAVQAGPGTAGVGWKAAW
jgi:hypothetical protein